jgi:hypothetical protein
LDIDTFFQQNTLEQRILVPKHQALVRRCPMTLLEVLESLFMVLDGSFELLDVLGTSLTERGLRLAISLLPLL